MSFKNKEIFGQNDSKSQNPGTTIITIDNL